MASARASAGAGAAADMVTLDTNVLLRYLVSTPGDEIQCAAARRLVAGASQVFIPVSVCCELVWVLSKSFHITDADIVAMFDRMLAMPGKFVLAEAEVRSGVAFMLAGGDFADGVNACAGALMSRGAGAFATFDKRAAKLFAAQGFSVVVPR